jgi:hypothetical protein
MKMKIKNKLIALILAFAMIACFFASCGGDSSKDTEGLPSDSNNVNDSVESTDGETEAETEPPVTDISLIEDSQFIFSVIVSSDSKLAARDAMYEIINNLYMDLGIVAKFHNDKTESSTKELLIGVTNRPESSEAEEGLKKDDYVIRYVRETGNIVIMGGSKDATVAAAKYFTENFIDKENKTFVVSSDLDYVYKVATEELGMVYANKNQVRLYNKTESEYVRQYEDIPER